MNTLAQIREEADHDLLDLLDPETMYALIDCVYALRLAEQYINPDESAQAASDLLTVLDALAPWAEEA
jgi:hypothetical protein